jgi:hypothetical protein
MGRGSALPDCFCETVISLYFLLYMIWHRLYSESLVDCPMLILSKTNAFKHLAEEQPSKRGYLQIHYAFWTGFRFIIRSCFQLAHMVIFQSCFSSPLSCDIKEWLSCI